MPAPVNEAFENSLRAIEDVEGWLTTAQAARLWEAASRGAAAPTIVEIGSYRGRSAIVLAHAAPAGGRVFAIDPHAGNDRGPGEFVGRAEEGQADFEAMRDNLARAGVEAVVRHVRLPSQEAFAAVTRPVNVLYVDGAHRYRTARDDLAHWGARVTPTGTMLVHDSFASVGVTAALFRVVVFSRRWEYRGRTGSLAEYTRADLRGVRRLKNAGRQIAELAWLVRNVLVKLALLARLRPLALMLGHRSKDGPY